MAGADFVEVALRGFSCCLVPDGDDAVDSDFVEGLFDEVVVLACSDEGEEMARVGFLVAFHDVDGGLGEVDFDGARAFVFGFARDVLDVDAVVCLCHIVFGEVEEVAAAAAYIALEDEDVSCHLDFRHFAKVALVEAVSFFGGEVERGSEALGFDGVFAEGVVGCVSHVDAPSPEGADCAHVGDDGVFAALAGYFFVVAVLPCVFVFAYGLEGCAVFELLFFEEFVLVAKEVFDCQECVGGSCGEVNGSAGIQFVAADDVEDALVAFLSLFGEFLEFEETFEGVEEGGVVFFFGFELFGVE